MKKIARICVLIGLCLQVLGSFVEYWRFGRPASLTDLVIAALLIGLLFRNPDRWIHAVGFFAVLGLFSVMAEWLIASRVFNLFLVLELLQSLVFAASAVYLSVAQRRGVQPSDGQMPCGRVLLGAVLLLALGMLSQVTWRIWHAFYVVPKVMMADVILPRWQMWLIDVSVDWQLNHRFWTFLLALALIVVMGAQDRAKLFCARLFLATYLSLIATVSIGYLAAG
jgi:hypothetical protein